MNFDEVIFAHSNWKNRFKLFLEGKEKLEQHIVAKDNLCELGKWLSGAGKVHAHLPEYGSLKEKHTHFHTVAAQIVAQAPKLPQDKARQLVDVGTDYAKASAACVNAISTLRRVLGEKSSAAAPGKP
jgi:hypothetical protein